MFTAAPICDEMLDQHRGRRRPVIGRGGDDRGGARFLRMARERGGDAGAGIAHMRDHRHAAFDAFDRELEQRPALRIGQAHRLARMHRQRQRVRAVADVELDQLVVKLEVDAPSRVNGVTGVCTRPGLKW